ncbi:MAG: undecaprenyl-diphosphate phosphatase [Gammaproteobacteria bacterium]|nr:undecaprenyl-diphosphate phosphatase [Gammaproteobacteria bacterium]
MEWLHIIVLSLVQGITEFLPISSSAHLILTPHLFDWPDQGLAFDVAVHVGTLIAVITYFRVELRQMLMACVGNGPEGCHQRDARLSGLVTVATLPAMLVGLVFHDFIANDLRNPLVIASTTIGFGLLLLAANRERADARDEYGLTYALAIIIGLTQVLAFIPGTSRSGITMTAAVMLGMRRESAARFSFLLSIPIILAGGVYKSLLLVQSDQAVAWGSLFLGVALSAISAFACIYWFLQFIQKFSFTPFVIYRLLLGAVLLVIFV